MQRTRKTYLPLRRCIYSPSAVRGGIVVWSTLRSANCKIFSKSWLSILMALSVPCSSHSNCWITANYLLQTNRSLMYFQSLPCFWFCSECDYPRVLGVSCVQFLCCVWLERMCSFHLRDFPAHVWSYAWYFVCARFTLEMSCLSFLTMLLNFFLILINAILRCCVF